jgi:integrase
MKGHLRERSPGHWAIILDARDPATGKRRRRWRSFAGSKRQAQIECARLVSQLQGGTYLEPSKLTLAQYLDKWLDHINPLVTPKTFERYSGIVTNNLKPVLGGIVLTKLQPMHISEAYAKLLTKGRRDGKGGLSSRSVHHCHTILKQALGQAVRWRTLPHNPADAVEPPRVERGAMTTYDLAQTGSLLDATRGTPMFVPAMLAVLCGLRRGEICALQWKYVDLAAGQLAVTRSAEQTKAGVRYKEPKSGRARTVALSATVVEELRRHRLEQAQALLRFGVRVTEDAFVFTQFDGAPYPPDRLTRAWISLAEKSSLPRIRFHDLRHAHATHLLAAGVHPKVASERLGHSRVGITLDLYSHATPGMQRDAADIVDAALQKAIKGGS